MPRSAASCGTAQAETSTSSGVARFELLCTFLVEAHEFSLSLTELIELVQGDGFSSNAAVQTLLTLAIDGPQRPGVLAVEAGITAGGMTNLLDRLETAGFVSREQPSSGDRRAVVVGLSQSGQDVADRTATAVRLAFALADRLLEHWRSTFTELGFEVGSSPVDVDHSQLDLVREIMRIGSELHASLAAEDVFGPDEPSPAAFLNVLSTTAKRSGVRPRDIARTEHLSPAGATELLDRMQRAGLIERVRGTGADGRSVEVHILERGRQALEAAVTRVEPIVERLARILYRA